MGPRGRRGTREQAGGRTTRPGPKVEQRENPGVTPGLPRAVIALQ